MLLHNVIVVNGVEVSEVSLCQLTDSGLYYSIGCRMEGVDDDYTNTKHAQRIHMRACMQTQHGISLSLSHNTHFLLCTKVFTV